MNTESYNYYADSEYKNVMMEGGTTHDVTFNFGYSRFISECADFLRRFFMYYTTYMRNELTGNPQLNYMGGSVQSNINVVKSHEGGNYTSIANLDSKIVDAVDSMTELMPNNPKTRNIKRVVTFLKGNEQIHRKRSDYFEALMPKMAMFMEQTGGARSFPYIKKFKSKQVADAAKLWLEHRATIARLLCTLNKGDNIGEDIENKFLEVKDDEKDIEIIIKKKIDEVNNDEIKKILQKILSKITETSASSSASPSHLPPSKTYYGEYDVVMYIEEVFYPVTDNFTSSNVDFEKHVYSSIGNFTKKFIEKFKDNIENNHDDIENENILRKNIQIGDYTFKKDNFEDGRVFLKEVSTELAGAVNDITKYNELVKDSKNEVNKLKDFFKEYNTGAPVDVDDILNHHGSLITEETKNVLKDKLFQGLNQEEKIILTKFFNNIFKFVPSGTTIINQALRDKLVENDHELVKKLQTIYDKQSVSNKFMTATSVNLMHNDTKTRDNLFILSGGSNMIGGSPEKLPQYLNMALTYIYDEGEGDDVASALLALGAEHVLLAYLIKNKHFKKDNIESKDHYETFEYFNKYKKDNIVERGYIKPLFINVIEYIKKNKITTGDALVDAIILAVRRSKP